MSDEHVDDVLMRLLGVFGEPKTPHPDVLVKEYRRVLARFSPEVLNEAIDRLIEQSTFWPKPAEIATTAYAVARAQEARRGVHPTDWDAVEAERRQGWQISDLAKAKISDEAKARVQALVDEFKRSVAERAIEALEDPHETDWMSGQRDEFEEMQRTSVRKGLHRRPH